MAVLPFAGTGSARAELIDPGVLNPGLQQQQQMQQQLEQQLPEVQRGKPKPLIQQPQQQAPEGAADPELLINRVQVQGATVIPVAELEAPFAPLLGK